MKKETWLITGGTGSLGKALTRYILDNLDPKKVIIFSRDELKQSQMIAEFNDTRLRFILGDVRQRKGLRAALRSVDVVIHAAALKQVPACEYSVSECILTNVTGSENVAELSIDVGVKKVLLISTDKACLPINTYGKSKALAESIFIQSNALASGTKTILSAVRYGNVMGSRGSVIPLFRESEVISITNKEMTRFWITMKQAVEFVVNAVKDMQGGEIFVPRIPACKITDLALAIDSKKQHKITGIRPGEKIHEVLVSKEEARNTVIQNNRIVILPAHHWFDRGLYTGKKLKEAYTSNQNLMNIGEIKHLLGEV